MSIPTHITDGLEDFTGRQWAFERLNAWLETRNSHTFLITGEPGCGKSTIAARLVQFSAGETSMVMLPHLAENCLTYAHFCQARFDSTLDPLRFVEALSRQLAYRYQPFAFALTQMYDQDITINATSIVGIAESGSEVTGVVIKELHIGNLSARVAFDRLVRKPLEQLCTATFQETLLILVDALDEALTYPGDENIVMLLEHTTDLPHQVHFLFTSRPDPRVSHLIGDSSLDLINDAPDDMDDVRAYASKRLHSLTEPRRSELANRVAEAGNGNFLYARYVVNDLLSKTDLFTDLSGLVLPKDLKDIYRQFLKRELGQNLEQWEERYRLLFGVIATARGQGLTRRQLAGMTKARMSKVDSILRACAQYLTGSLPHGPFRIYHQSFRDFLMEDEEYQVYPGEANQTIADFFLKEYTGNWSNCKENYALQYLPTHLIEAMQQLELRQEQQKLVNVLIAVLIDLDFLEAKTAHLGIDVALIDLRTALNQAFPNDRLSDLSSLEDVLDRESHTLREWNRERHPFLFAQQVYYRAMEMELVHLAEVAKTRLTQLKHTFLELQWMVGSQSVALERTLTGHTDSVSAVAISPDGHQAVSGSWDLTLRVWDLQSGRLLHTLTGHEGSVYAVAITPDGHQAISCSNDDTLRVWDLQSGRLLHTLTGHEGSVYAVAITPDSLMAVSGSIDNTLRVWDLQSGRLLHTLTGHKFSVHAVAITPDSLMAVSCSDDHTLRVWDLQSGRLLHTLTGHTHYVHAVAITPDSLMAVSCSDDDTLRVWDLQSGRLLHTLTGHEGSVHAVAITPDGHQAISCSNDDTLRVWDLQSGRLLHTLTGHEGSVHAVAITPDGHQAVSCSFDNTLRVWDLHMEQSLNISSGHLHKVTSVAITPNSRFAISASEDKTLKVWDLQSGQLLHTLTGQPSTVYEVAITADSRCAISVSIDETIRIWDLQNGQLLNVLSELYLMNRVQRKSNQNLVHYESLKRAVTLTSDGRYAISGSWEGTLSMWDLQSGQLVKKLEGHTSKILVVVVTVDSRLIISGSTDKTLKVWDLQSGQLLYTLTGHEAPVRAVAVTFDSCYAVSSAEDHTLRVWDLQNGQLLRSFTNDVAEVSALAISSNSCHAFSVSRGSPVVTNSIDGPLRMWDLQNGQEETPISLLSGIGCISLTPHGNIILVGDAIGNIYCLRYVHPGAQ